MLEDSCEYYFGLVAELTPDAPHYVLGLCQALLQAVRNELFSVDEAHEIFFLIKLYCAYEPIPSICHWDMRKQFVDCLAMFLEEADIPPIIEELDEEEAKHAPANAVGVPLEPPKLVRQNAIAPTSIMSLRAICNSTKIALSKVQSKCKCSEDDLYFDFF